MNLNDLQPGDKITYVNGFSEVVDVVDIVRILTEVGKKKNPTTNDARIVKVERVIWSKQ